MVIVVYAIRCVRKDVEKVEDVERIFFFNNSKVFSSRSSLLRFLNHEYMELAYIYYNRDSVFEWIIKDFFTGEIFSGSCELFLGLSFTDLVSEEHLSKYLYSREDW